MSDTTTTVESSTQPVQSPPKSPTPKAPDAPRDAASEPLGQPGLKALREEREAREALERQIQPLKDQVQELQPLKEQMEALRSIFGDKAADAGQDIVKTLQQTVDAMQRDGLVDRVARRHGITDDADVEFLHNATDEAAMTRLAERLKVPAATPPRTPAPDPAQANHAPALSQDDAEYEAFFPSTPKH